MVSDGTLVEDGYSESLPSLVVATNEVMAKYHIDEGPQVVASIAQRVSVKEKIELSIAYVGFGIFLFPLLVTYYVIASGRKVRSYPRGHSTSDGDHRILENAPKERRLSWSHVGGMLAGHS
jgi:hypothetical protein